ncbi:hypothetical protein RT717_10990 [Imperialibacter roseus]|uniref:Uncharacterized protein n=1 Tax=Imperialibacter roseus TaxID=1324217 RepID=A0ABZ0IX01_9BACT|nr:hypothetical protein [Imperialibacter roseus]WOK09161.1 hypothetical protein RT717_10990 [Imperialibacter roseus]
MITIEELVTLGVKKLRKFGYTHVNEQNILTDEVYRVFFEKILKERLEKNKEEQEDISHLLEKITFNSSNISPP